MTERPIDLVTCPDCGAGNPKFERRCWLCRRLLDGGNAPAAGGATLERSDLWPPQDVSSTDNVLLVTLAIGVIIYAIVCFGVSREAPGIAIALAVIGVAPITATAVTAFRARQEGRLIRLGEVVLRMITGVAVVLGLIGAAGLAAVIAFCMWCFAELARNA